MQVSPSEIKIECPIGSVFHWFKIWKLQSYEPVITKLQIKPFSNLQYLSW